MRRLLANRWQTPDGKILWSKHRHEFQDHTDKNGIYYYIDGGGEYCRGSLTKMKNLCVYDDGTFKTQREIYQALLDGKKIMNIKTRAIVYMKDDGFINDAWVFSHPEDWSIFCTEHEPRVDAAVCKHCGVRLKMVWAEE